MPRLFCYQKPARWLVDGDSQTAWDQLTELTCPVILAESITDPAKSCLIFLMRVNAGMTVVAKMSREDENLVVGVKLQIKERQ